MRMPFAMFDLRTRGHIVTGTCMADELTEQVASWWVEGVEHDPFVFVDAVPTDRFYEPNELYHDSEDGSLRFVGDDHCVEIEHIGRDRRERIIAAVAAMGDAPAGRNVASIMRYVWTIEQARDLFDKFGVPFPEYALDAQAPEMPERRALGEAAILEMNVLAEADAVRRFDEMVSRARQEMREDLDERAYLAQSEAAFQEGVAAAKRQMLSKAKVTDLAAESRERRRMRKLKETR